MTIKDIARESGYAVGTVSRVLNGHPDVSENARAVIMGVVEKYNFRPNSNAKQLKQHNSKGVAILVKGVGNLLFGSMLEKIQYGFQQANCVAGVFYLDESDDEMSSAIQVCREFKPVGILFLGGTPSHFDARFLEIKLPCILATAPGANLGFPNLSSVSTDDTAGEHCAMEYLLNAGHRHFGIIAGSDCDFLPTQIKSLGQRRLSGCIQACQEWGIPLDLDTQIKKARYSSVAEGYGAASELLDQVPGITALLAMSDVTAIGAIRAIRDRNLRVPEDVSVIGFDGLNLGAYLNPRLTTIRQDTSRIAQRAVEILLSQLTGRNPAVHETVPFQLIEGESVCKL